MYYISHVDTNSYKLKKIKMLTEKYFFLTIPNCKRFIKTRSENDSGPTPTRSLLWK